MTSENAQPVPKQLSRRFLLRNVAGGGAAAIVAGVAGGAIASAVHGKIRYDTCGPRSDELTVLTDEDIAPGRVRREIIQDFVRPVTLIEMPQHTDHMRVELAVLAQTGSCRYDVVNVDIAWTDEIVGAGYLQPLPDPPSGLLPFAMATGRVNGRQYTIPFVTDAAILYYRKDLLGSQPLPRTFSATVALGSRLKAGLKSDEAVAYVGQFADYEGLTVNALEAIWSKGGDELSFSGNLRADRTQAALSHLVESVRNAEIAPDTDEQTSVDKFREGEAVFLRNWPFAFHQLYDAPQLKGRLGIAALPWRSVLGGHNLGITRNVTRPRLDDAHALIEYLTNTENQNALLRLGGNAPARESAYDQQACGGPHSLPDEISTPECEQLNMLAAELKRSLHNARRRPRGTLYSRYSQVLRRHLSPALTGQAELDFKHMQDDVDAIVQSGSVRRG